MDEISSGKNIFQRSISDILAGIISGLLMIIISNRSYSQTPEIEWQKSFGGSGADFGYTAIPTSDGGYIITGETSSANQQVHGNHGTQDFCVVKVDAVSDAHWTKTYGGSTTKNESYLTQIQINAT